jgi:hypothetical protein
MLGITEHHDLLSTKAIHPEVRGSKVVTKKHTLLSQSYLSREDVPWQVAHDIRAKDMQILDQVVT